MYSVITIDSGKKVLIARYPTYLQATRKCRSLLTENPKLEHRLHIQTHLCIVK